MNLLNVCADIPSLRRGPSPFRVSLFNLNRQHITAEPDPHSGRNVLNFPMRQMGQERKGAMRANSSLAVVALQWKRIRSRKSQ